MALDGEIMRFIGNELMNTGSKGLAKAGAKATLSSLIPEVATKAATSLATNAGADMATKALSLGLSRSPEGNWLMDTSSWNTGGTKDLKDFVRPMLGGEETPNYQRFLEQIGEGNYRGSLNGHTPGWFDDDGNVIPSTLDNIEGNGDILPKIYGDNREATLRGLLSLGNRGDEAMKSASVIANYRGKPNELATIYRQSPKDINYGDWVGLTDSYANLHEGNSEMNKLWSKQVPANEVFFAGDDINEWYYMPKEVKLDAELGKALDNAMGYAKQNVSLYAPAGIEKANIVNGRLSDANGNPLRVYHSTPNEFTEFDDSKLGQNTGYENTSYGHFTTPDKQFSERFKDINNEGLDGQTMELQVKAQKPITHPYYAGLKYDEAESDQIVRNYLKAVGAEETIPELEEMAAEDGVSLYDAYMNMTIGEDPYELAKYERDDLMKNGYDAMEIIEGRRNDIVDGAKETTPVSSIVAFEGKNLRPTTHLNIQAAESSATDIPVNNAVMEKVAKYLGSPTDANADGVINWNDVEAVYKQAQIDQKRLDQMGRSIAEKEGFPEYADFSPKSIESMQNKVARKGGDYSLASMKDHTRNKIIMNGWEDVPAVLADLEEMGVSPMVEFVQNDWGYKGLHITGRFENGLGWEIQLSTPEDWPRKLKSDAIYDKWRNVQLDTASPKDVLGYMNAMRESKAMWSKSNIPDLSRFDNTGA